VTYSQELHWRLVAKWHGYKWSDFIELEGNEQSRMVATYETSMQIEAAMQKEAQREANRKNRRKH
jgi:hypothetical protein